MPGSGLYQIGQSEAVEQLTVWQLLEAKEAASNALRDSLGRGSVYVPLILNNVLIDLFEQISPQAREYADFHEFIGSTPLENSQPGAFPEQEKLLEVLWLLVEKVTSEHLGGEEVIIFLERAFKSDSVERERDPAVVRMQKGTRRFLKAKLSKKVEK